MLRQVLQNLQNVVLTLNKGQFYKSEIELLGHVWSAKGISNSPEKLQALRTMSLPKDKQSLHFFLGLAAYLGQGYIGHYSSRIKPLWDMLCYVMTLDLVVTLVLSIFLVLVTIDRQHDADRVLYVKAVWPRPVLGDQAWTSTTFTKHTLLAFKNTTC